MVGSVRGIERARSALAAYAAKLPQQVPDGRATKRREEILVTKALVQQAVETFQQLFETRLQEALAKLSESQPTSALVPRDGVVEVLILKLPHDKNDGELTLADEDELLQPLCQTIEDNGLIAQIRRLPEDEPSNSGDPSRTFVYAVIPEVTVREVGLAVPLKNRNASTYRYC